MTEFRTFVDPTGEQSPAGRVLPARPATLQGLSVGLLDIAKPRSDVFLDRIEQRLSAQGITVRRYRKPTMTKVAPIEIKQRIAAECNVVIEGLAD
jgi:hypothetical protein